MMEVLLRGLQRKRLVVALTGLLLMMGLFAWTTMPRQEDPSFVPRFATLVVPFPGADAERVERLVLEPLHDELAAVVDLREVNATARSGVAVLQLRLNDTVYDTDAAWDDVRRAIDDAALPDEAGPLRFDDAVGDPASIVLLVTGSADRIALRDGARVVQQALRQVPGVARIDWVADPGATVRVTVEPGAARRLNIEPAQLASLLQSRNLTLPGGSLVNDGRTLVLRPHTELESLDALRRTPIPLPGGAAVPLSEVATVQLTADAPAPAALLHNGEPAVGLSIIPIMPRDLTAFGESVHDTLAGLDLDGLQVQVFADQPAQVGQRLGELTQSLALGVLVVALVLFVAMGPRLGMVVSSVVPIVAIATMGVYAAGGGVLHQISIAALVLALGLLVDNAIVVAEAVQQHLDAGKSPNDAAQAAVRELATPLFTATGTTLAAFAPMLLSSGGTADFTRTIPIVVVTALILSYLAAIAVTPLMSALVLRPSDGQASALELRATRIGAWVTHRPRTVVAGVLGMLLVTGSMLPMVQQQFFPLSDLARLVVTVELPEGTHIGRTEDVVADLANDLATLEHVTATTAFIGRGPPRFYYNLNDVPSAPHAATIVLTLDGKQGIDSVLTQVRQRAHRTPEGIVVAKRLQQGPPVGAPVELRFSGPDLAELHHAAQAAVRILRDIDGTADVRTTEGLGVAQLAMHFDDAAATRRRTSRSDVALGLLGRTRGLPAGTWTGSWDNVPVEVRGIDGEHLSPERIDGLSIRGVPVGQVVSSELRWGPAAIQHRNGVRTVRVLAELTPGVTFSQVQSAARPALSDLGLTGVSMAWGGESEGSGEANAALLSALPVGVGLLLIFLLLEFDSFRRAALVLLTVPLAATGVVPGLALSGSPFGFMSLLGVIALTGIVVNNAIVLIDRIDRAREEGMTVRDAVQDSIRVRLRPILLTTATTVSGMLPLALSSSSLWPPLAWAMISGLMASTVLTVLAVPALYVMWFDDTPGPRWWRRLPLLSGLLVATSAAAQPLTIDDVLAQAAQAPLAEAAQAGAQIASHDARTAWLSALGPAVGATLTTAERDGPVEVNTPFGPLPQQAESQVDAGADASVPLLRASAWAQGVAASRGASATATQARRQVQDQQRRAADIAFDILTLQAQRQAQQAYVDALDAVRAQIAERETAGLVTAADGLRAGATTADATQALFAINAQHHILQLQLGALLGRTGSVDVVGSRSTETTSSPSTRPDLDAAQTQVRALSAQRAAVALEWVPDVELYGKALHSSNEALVDNTWLEVGLRATWTPIARGTRLSRMGSIGAQRAQAAAQAEALELQIAVDQAQAQAQINIAEQAIISRSLQVQQAEEASLVLEERYAMGLATLTDVLQVRAELRSAQTGLAVAQVERQRAWVQEGWARGVL